MTDTKRRVALVTGASRGVGRGIALGLGEAGFSVYVTGRTLIADGSEGIPGSLERTVSEIAELGGIGVAVRCDHTDDRHVTNLFGRIERESGRLDLLVNAAWGGYEHMFDSGEGYIWERPFWRQNSAQWDGMFDAGVRAAYVASSLAAKRMTRSRSGIILNLSHPAARTPSANVAYGVSKAATDKLTEECARHLHPFTVAVLSLYPGLVRTERVMLAAQALDLTNSESPQFVGRVVAALAGDPRVMEKSGKAHVIAHLAREYGVLDTDGSGPSPVFDVTGQRSDSRDN